MELRRELLLTIGILVALHLVMAFGAIGLFARMGPAIEHIMKENVVSIVAAEEMLAELALQGDGAASEASRARMQEALERARANVTEEAEKAVILRLQTSLQASAETGEAARGARQSAVADLRALIRINRDAMHQVDRDAKRLGSAGAWAAVLIGFVSFVLSMLIVVRLQKRFVRPLVDLHEVLESARRGEELRRCRKQDAPREVIMVTDAVNHLLDERLRRRRDVQSGS